MYTEIGKVMFALKQNQIVTKASDSEQQARIIFLQDNLS
jgi:hypothetical protein